MKINDIKGLKEAYTHSMKFHSDDVFSAAFLKIINPRIKIIRVNKLPNDFEGLAFDIGLKEFDHHQPTNEKRENGIPYAAFGKLWKAFSKGLYGEYVYQKVDKMLVEDLDLTDNCGVKNNLATAISVFNPLDGSNGDAEFDEAVYFAKEILKRLIKRVQKYEKDTLEVKKIYEQSTDKRIIVLDKYLYYDDFLPSTEAMYVIYPNNRSKGFAAKGVTINSDTVELKKDFPKNWVNHLPDYIKFCHNARFLITTNTLEDAIKACEEAINNKD